MLEWNYIYKSQLIKQSNHYQFRLRNVFCSHAVLRLPGIDVVFRSQIRMTLVVECDIDSGRA